MRPGVHQDHHEAPRQRLQSGWELKLRQHPAWLRGSKTSSWTGLLPQPLLWAGSPLGFFPLSTVLSAEWSQSFVSGWCRKLQSPKRILHPKYFPLASPPLPSRISLADNYTVSHKLSSKGQRVSPKLQSGLLRLKLEAHTHRHRHTPQPSLSQGFCSKVVHDHGPILRHWNGS